MSIMLCTRCVRGALSTTGNALRQAFKIPQASRTMQQTVSQRSFGILSTTPLRPTLPKVQLETSSSDVAFTITAQPLLQVRGAKRDTFKPSHVTRKRRHGFLSRLRTRNGRKTLLRRRLKGRNTLSH